MEIHELGTTTQFHSPLWNGYGFHELKAHNLWIRLPQVLKDIAVKEVGLGNVVESILENRDSNIVLLSFSNGPLSNPEIGVEIKVHKTHSGGNYCYDGIRETFEHIESGCFLSFEDPGYEEESF